MDPEQLTKRMLKENRLCVLATASLTGKHEAATIEYTEDEEVNLFFETFPSYRKYPNLKQNPQVSIVITENSEEPRTIQMDGRVFELSGKIAEEAKQRCIAKHGKGKRVYNDPEIRFFKFTLDCIKVLTHGGYPPRYKIIRNKKVEIE